MSQFAILSHRVPYFLALLMLMSGCQLSYPVRNKSGSALDATREADLDFSEGRHKVLLGVSPKSAAFKDFQGRMDTYGIKVMPYFSQCPEDSIYSSSYNETMNIHLTKLHGNDVVGDAINQLFPMQYFPSETKAQEEEKMPFGQSTQTTQKPND